MHHAKRLSIERRLPRLIARGLNGITLVGPPESDFQGAGIQLGGHAWRGIELVFGCQANGLRHASALYYSIRKITRLRLNGGLSFSGHSVEQKTCGQSEDPWLTQA